MIVNSHRFGQLEVPEDKVITMARPILGFENLSQFCLVDLEQFRPMLWLQSVDDADISFLVVNPRLFYSDYEISINPAEIAELKLKTIAPGLKRAFLVEQFNRIMVSKTQIAGFKPGIEVFIEKEDLLPFEEAKLYGHNAIHALLAYLGYIMGYTNMAELKTNGELMQIARNAFIEESGAALIKKYKTLNDELFTQQGFTQYVDDLLERMTNPFLNDSVANRLNLYFDNCSLISYSCS